MLYVIFLGWMEFLKPFLLKIFLCDKSNTVILIKMRLKTTREALNQIFN